MVVYEFFFGSSFLVLEALLGGSHPAMGDQVFRFGKHRGRRFSEVARSDTSYVRWAKNQGTEASGLKLFFGCAWFDIT